MPIAVRNSGLSNLAIVITRPTVFRGRSVDVGAEFDNVTPDEWASIYHRAKVRTLPPAVRAAPVAPTPVVETASAEPRRETSDATPAKVAKKFKAR